MLSKRRPKKLSSKHVEKVTGKHILYCSQCDDESMEVSLEITKFTCSYCVQKLVAPPENYNKKKDTEKFPRGWHFKKRFEGPDGKVYSLGKLVETESVLTDNIIKNTEVEVVIKRKRGRPKKDASVKKVIRRKKRVKNNTKEDS